MFGPTEKQTEPIERVLESVEIRECSGVYWKCTGPSKNVEPTAGLHLGFCKKEKKRKPNFPFVMKNTMKIC